MSGLYARSRDSLSREGESFQAPGIQPIAKSTIDRRASEKGINKPKSTLYTGFSCENKVKNHGSQRCTCGECSSQEIVEGFGEKEAILGFKGRMVDPRGVLDSFGLWLLPGHGESYVDCGSWRSKGCLNVEAHNQALIDGQDAIGKVFVRRYRRSCLRAECPTCYEGWAGREAGRIEHRLAGAGKLLRVIHVVVSPSIKDIFGLSYEKLRAKCYSILKKSGVRGGSVIFHPFREEELTKMWYLSPHFHVLGYGWVKGTKEGFGSHGWIVKNIGLRKTVSGTALYQLSHAGIHPHYHTITWFGVLAYNKLWVPPREMEKDVCPICGSELKEIQYFGCQDLPEEEGDYWLDPDGWGYKVGRFGG